MEPRIRAAHLGTAPFTKLPLKGKRPRSITSPAEQMAPILDTEIWPVIQPGICTAQLPQAVQRILVSFLRWIPPAQKPYCTPLLAPMAGIRKEASYLTLTAISMELPM